MRTRLLPAALVCAAAVSALAAGLIAVTGDDVQATPSRSASSGRSHAPRH